MTKGALEAKSVKVSENQVAESIQRVVPVQYEQRRNDTMDRINPILYLAEYFGHKLHIDLNEKLKMFGVTHVVA